MQTSILCLVLFFITSNCTVVEIPNGKLLGSFNGKYYSFLNVPYAEPPTGEKRFEPPIPYTTKWSNIRNATLPAITCVQFTKIQPATNGVEDCLVLNIYTPAISCERTYPVQFYIHGGAFMSGSASNVDEVYLASSDVVVVIISYRLGPLGFLSSGNDMISGNWGLKDQQMALRWVHENINAFCGNNREVLLSGFSAGGASVHLHMLNSNSAKYFNAALSSSGVAVNPWAMQPNPQKQYNKFTTALGCQFSDNAQVKRCLQSVTKEQLFEAAISLKVFNNNPVNVFGVVVEPKLVPHAFLTENPRTLIKSGMISNIPWIVGYTEREGAYTASEFLSFDENGKELIEILNTRWHELAPIVLYYSESFVDLAEGEAATVKDDYSDYLRHAYMGEQRFDVEHYRLLENIFTDVMFMNGIKEMIELHRRFGKGPVYVYDYRNPVGYSSGNVISNRSDLNFGASHAADLSCVLPLKSFRQLNVTCTSYDKYIGDNLISMIVELSTSGEAIFDSRKLPINNATHNGKLTIFKTQHQIESCTPQTCTLQSYVNNADE